MASEYRADLESILKAYYIRYERLMELNVAAFANTKYGNCTEIDVYVDVYDMLNILYNINLKEDQAYVYKKYVIASSIINLAAHIRHYYASRHRSYARIFLVYADCSCESHRKFLNTFGQSKNSIRLNYLDMNNIIVEHLNLIQILSAYIPEVYLVKKTCDFATFCNYSIPKLPNKPAVLLTKSTYAYQVVAMNDNAVIFRPQKTKGNDISYLVNGANAITRFINSTKADTNVKIAALNPNMLGLIMALTKLTDKSIQSLMNSTTAINKLIDAIKGNKIINGYNGDSIYLHSCLNLDPTINVNTLFSRFNAIDIVTQTNIYDLSPESKDLQYLIDLNDPDTLKDINNQYFIDNPINLDVF